MTDKQLKTAEQLACALWPFVKIHRELPVEYTIEPTPVSLKTVQITVRTDDLKRATGVLARWDYANNHD